MTEENLKVAVRVRPYNEREISHSSKCIVSMKGKITSVTNPENPNDVKPFTYDFSYWSFDGCKDGGNGVLVPDSSSPRGSNYADQQRVYQDLGKGILNNAWQGYNSCLFAYGQTGSGKSYSVIGYGKNKGIVPMLCEDIFKGIKEKSGKGIEFEVRFSMLEIYNELVRDLLDGSKGKASLKVREHTKKGFYAENLKNELVSSYEEIHQKMNQGTVNRTIANTNMNQTSSRAHTIVGISLLQKFKNATGQETTKQATLNLVDLAGSERVSGTGATGERLKEGAGINQSLSCLGNCIHALADQSKGKQVKVPYRDSSLTKLLMNALGGNSKTIMIAAISPADLNHEETLSTLRYADRAKEIKTKAVINEDPTEKLLRELREENDRLKKNMKTGKYDDFIDEDGDGIDDREYGKLKGKWEEEMQARIKNNDKEMENMKKTYEEKLRQQAQNATATDNSEILRLKEEKKSKAHIYNLNPDPQLTGRIVHILKPGKTTIGNQKGKESDITMMGPGIHEQHAVMTLEKDGKASLKPVSTDCRVLLNGGPVKGDATLSNDDRLVFGSTQIWVYQNPAEKAKSKKASPQITYEYVQQEIAAKNGVNVNATDVDTSRLQEELLEVMPAVEEANSISEELDKKVKFEITLLAPQVMGQAGGKTRIQVKMKNFENGTEFVWPKEKFLDRLYMMKEMYRKFEEEDEKNYGGGNNVPPAKSAMSDKDKKKKKDDPFKESLDTEVHIGTVLVILQPLAYNVELKEQLEITNYKGAEVGVMNVEIVPCDANGKEYSEADDKFVDYPEDLIGKEIHFKVKIQNCRGLPNRYIDMYCAYSMYLNKEEICSKKISETSNPDFGHVKQYDFKPVTKQFVEYLQNGNLPIRVMGKQKANTEKNSGLTTKDMLKDNRTVFSNTGNHPNMGFNMNGKVADPQKQSILTELLLMKKTQARLQQKVDAMKKLVKEAEANNRHQVSTQVLKDILNSNSQEDSDKAIRKLQGNNRSGKEPLHMNLSELSSVCTLL